MCSLVLSNYRKPYHFCRIDEFCREVLIQICVKMLIVNAVVVVVLFFSYFLNS